MQMTRERIRKEENKEREINGGQNEKKGEI